MAADGQVTSLLHRWRSGSAEAENELFELVLPDLRRLARHILGGERKPNSMQATELVDQIYFRLVSAKDRDWESRSHFFAIAARAMRHHLIDRARARPRGDAVPLEGLENQMAASSQKLDQALQVDELLTRLQATKPEWVTLVEVKYFLGLTDEEAAEALGMKLRTLQKMWFETRKWLFERMEPGDAAHRSAGR